MEAHCQGNQPELEVGIFSPLLPLEEGTGAGDWVCSPMACIYQQQIMMRKVWGLLQEPSKESRQLVLKRPQIPSGFQGKVFKNTVKEGVCGCVDKLMDILVMGCWWGNLESTSLTFWFQLVWGLCACGQHRVNLFRLVRVSISAEQLKGHGSEYHL